MHPSVVNGELAALASALLWAVASLIFDRAGRSIKPIELNLLKGMMALCLLLITAFVSGQSFVSMQPITLVLLLSSGVIGIAMGDTTYFQSLNLLGVRRSLLLITLSPAFASIIAWVLLGETLKLHAWAGILLTLAGIAWVVTEQAGDTQFDPRHKIRGIAFGLLAALGWAVGSVLSRAGFAQSSASPLQSTLLRIAAGVVVLFIWSRITRMPIGQWLKLPNSRRLFAQASIATFLGTFLGMWLQQFALKHTVVGIAQTLSSTSPLFILPLSIWTKERLSLRAVLGALVAFSGIILLFL